jgi:CRISPR-associated protein Csc1
MKIYHCLLTLHDNVFFATREMGILFETEKYLHNWALSYALFKGIHIPHAYHLQGDLAQKPDYLDESREQNLIHLNKVGIYVFPAKPIQWSYQINTFKAAQVSYYGKSEQFEAPNYPKNYGRAKELAVGSIYHSYLIFLDDLHLPEWLSDDKYPEKNTWIRLGKWSAKVKVKATLIPDNAIQSLSGEYICEHPLNPIDLSPDTQLILYNRVVMPPVSLVSQAQLNGSYLKLSGDNWKALKQSISYLPNEMNLPQGVSYGAKQLINA